MPDIPNLPKDMPITSLISLSHHLACRLHVKMPVQSKLSSLSSPILISSNPLTHGLGSEAAILVSSSPEHAGISGSSGAGLLGSGLPFSYSAMDHGDFNGAYAEVTKLRQELGKVQMENTHLRAQVSAAWYVFLVCVLHLLILKPYQECIQFIAQQFGSKN